MRSTTVVSKVVHLFTGAEFTHVAIGTDPEELYTFSRYDMRYLFPAGLVHEHPYSDVYHAVYELDVSFEQYLEFMRVIKSMWAVRSEYKFNVLGIPLAYFGIAMQRQGVFFCSQWASYILRRSGIYSFSKPDELVRPVDFLTIPNIQRCS